MTTTQHPNTAILEDVYADLSCIGLYLSCDAVLHPADGGDDVQGKAAIEQHEMNLIKATNYTLVMDVGHIYANDHFGSVHGVIRAHLEGKDIAMPFCGLWRFNGPQIIEHWENAYDPTRLGRFLNDRGATR